MRPTRDPVVPVVAAALAALGLLAVRVAGAELLIVDGQVQARTVESGPARGTSMKAVEERFGAPESRSEAVGQPPITRWDYAGFSVFFEFDKVIHTVARGG